MNFIHPTAIIGPNAALGIENYIGPYCYIDNCVMGNGNRFEAFVSIGTPPEHKNLHLDPMNGFVNIGNFCVFKEFVTINRGTIGNTEIHDDVWMLRGSHAGHDSKIHSRANISCSALVGGHSIIMEGANLGLNAIIHQNLVVGAFAMVGMNSTVTKDVIPFSTTFGSPAQIKTTNSIGMRRSGFTDEEIRQVFEWQSSYPFKPEDYPMTENIVRRMLSWKAQIRELRGEKVHENNR